MKLKLWFVIALAAVIAMIGLAGCSLSAAQTPTAAPVSVNVKINKESG